MSKDSNKAPEWCYEACDLVADGLSLRKALVEVGKSRQAFYKQKAQDNELVDYYAQAIAARAEYHFDGLRGMANKPVADPLELQQLKLRIDAEKWILARENRAYADRQTLDHQSSDGSFTVNAVIQPVKAPKADDE